MEGAAGLHFNYNKLKKDPPTTSNNLGVEQFLRVNDSLLSDSNPSQVVEDSESNL